MHRLLLRNKFSETNYNHVLKQNVRNFSVDCCFRGKCSFVRPTRELSRKKIGTRPKKCLWFNYWCYAYLLIMAGCPASNNSKQRRHISRWITLLRAIFTETYGKMLFTHKLTYKSNGSTRIYWKNPVQRF